MIKELAPCSPTPAQRAVRKQYTRTFRVPPLAGERGRSSPKPSDSHWGVSGFLSSACVFVQYQNCLHAILLGGRPADQREKLSRLASAFKKPGLTAQFVDALPWAMAAYARNSYNISGLSPSITYLVDDKSRFAYRVQCCAMLPDGTVECQVDFLRSSVAECCRKNPEYQGWFASAAV